MIVITLWPGTMPSAFHHNRCMLQSLHSPLSSRWFAAVSTLAVWAAAAAGVAYWSLQFAGASGPGAQVPTALRHQPAEPALADVQKALGAAASQAVQAQPDAASRFVLSGVVALHSGQGAALIAVDGQAPKAFKVGHTVVEGWVLQSLAQRQARLGIALQGPSAVTLDMPPLPETATALRASQ